jgi:hypothetical protein
MSTSKILTHLPTGRKAAPMAQGLRRPQRGLAVRTDLRAGGWDEIDDQVAAFWENLMNTSAGGEEKSTQMSA